MIEKSAGRLVVDASNSGGGAAVLLSYLAKSLRERSLPHIFLASVRVDVSGSPCKTVRGVRPISRQRTKLLRELEVGISPTSLLCFGNIPPSWKPANARVYTYFHNALLLSSTNRSFLSVRDRIRIFAIRSAMRIYRSNTDFWIVQTPLVKRLLVRSLGITNEKVLVVPFYSESEKMDTIDSEHRLDFFYSSSCLAHKNHLNLIKAFILLSKRGLNFSVGLTIDRDASVDLAKHADIAIKAGSKIVFLGSVSYAESLRLTQNSGAVIFPSLVETVGLGLVEAADAGKPVLVGDLAWPKEIVDTPYVFDPMSAESIADSIERYSESAERISARRIITNQIDELCRVLYEQFSLGESDGC